MKTFCQYASFVGTETELNAHLVKLQDEDKLEIRNVSKVEEYLDGVSEYEILIQVTIYTDQVNA